MKEPVKKQEQSTTKRDLFAELSEGMEALAEARRGKKELLVHCTKKPDGPPEVLARYGHVTR
jgi:hypothetical protein